MDGLRKIIFLFYVPILNVLHFLFILEDLKMSTISYLGGVTPLLLPNISGGNCFPLITSLSVTL